MTEVSLSEPFTVAAAPRGTRSSRVLVLSILVHLIMVLVLVYDGRERAPPPPREIPVELVQEPPPEPKLAAKAAPAAKAKAPQAPARTQPPQPAAARRPPPPLAHQPRPPKPAEPPRPSPKPTDSPARESVAQRMDRLLGPMPAVPLPSTAADGDESVSYKQLVLSQVAKAKKVGRYKGVPGSASVGFTVGTDGALVRCEIVRKSVDPALDAEALAMVRRAAPFPPPPPGALREYVIGLRFQAMPDDPRT